LRMLLLELRLRALRVSSGSWGFSPLAFANRFRTSVKLTTPQRRPDILAPVMAAADMAGAGWIGGCVGDGEACRPLLAAAGSGVIGDGGTRMAGVMAGVGGPEEAGDGCSTTHMRCERVATSLATVWASVDSVFMWKTGKESLPSFTPRSERMTEMKWIQDELRSGRDVDFVRSLTST